MTREVYCQKLKKNAEGLKRQPYPGELGKQIFENISKEAWQLWLKQQTILINENHLNLLEAESKSFLEKAMKDFLFNSETEQ